MRESKTLVARTYTAASLVILGLLSLIIITLYFATPPAEKYDRTVLKSWPDPISWMCSSDKTKLLGYQQNDQSGRPENLIIWDLTTNSAEPQKIPLPDTPVAISPAGDYIATVKNNDLFLRPIRSNMSSRKYEHFSPSNFGFTPDGRFVFAISTDGKLRIWKPGENFDQKKDFTVANQKSVTVQASPLGRWLTVYDGVKLVRLVSCDNPSVAYALQGLQLWYNGSLPLHFTHHEDFVAYSTNDANVRVLDMSTGENNCLMRPAIQSSPGMPPLSSPQITFTPDDQTLLILFGNSSHSLYRWENDGTHKNTCVPMDDIPYYGPVPYTNDLAISPDSQLVAGNASRELCIWPLKQKSRLVGCKRLKCWSPLPPVFTRDGQRMAIVSTGGYFYVWNLNESFDADKYLDIMEQTCRPVTFSIDGTEILFTNNTQVFIYKILTNTYLDCLLQQPATDLVQILASSSQKHSTLLFTSYNVFSLQRVTAFLNITLAPANSPQFQSPFDLCPDIPSAVPTCVGPPIPPPEFVSGPKKLLPSKKARKQHQS
jgi:WD40 repeat protein